MYSEEPREIIENKDKGIIIKIKPTKSSWLPEGHDGHVRYTGCVEALCVCVNPRTRSLETGLTPKEEEWLEEVLMMEPRTLSKYNTEYWGDYANAIKIPREGLEIMPFDNPKDYIIYKNLIANPRVAISEDKRNMPKDEKSTIIADYIMTSTEQEAKIKNSRFKIKKDAYKLLDGLDIETQRNMYKICTGKTIGIDASSSVIESMVMEYIESNPQKFIDAFKDDDKALKMFINNALEAKALVKKGATFCINGGERIGTSLIDTVDYLKNPDNISVYESIRSKVDVYKESKNK